MSRMNRGKSRHHVTDESTQAWMAQEEWAKDHSFDMAMAESEWGRSVEDEHPMLGCMPEERRDGVFRGMSVQLNGLQLTRSRNLKSKLVEFLAKKYDLQFIGMGEVGINWLLAQRHGKRLLSAFPGLELEARSSVSNNTTEAISLHQQGGVGMLILGAAIPYYKRGSKDFRRLGRWDSSIIEAREGHRTRLVQVYALIEQFSDKIGSVYQQTIRYLQSNDLGSISPRHLLESDLLWQLRLWRASGERIILMMDANTHVLTGRLCRELVKEDIGLREITKDHLGELCPKTHIRGSKPIDGVWATSDITITAVQWLPFSQSPGDHRACIFEFTTYSALGTDEKKIVYPKCRRLRSSNPQSVSNYVREMERQFQIHRMNSRLDTLDTATEGLELASVPQEMITSHERLDNQTVEIQTHCEARCRQIYRTDAPFSPEYALWHKRSRIFLQLKRMIEGRVQNTGVLCKTARSLGIVHPKQWTLEEVLHGRAVCKAWKRELEKYAPALRSEHLRDRLVEAEAQEQPERAKALRAMIDKENGRQMWRQLQYAFKENGGRSNAVTRVERIENGLTVEYTSQSDIERVVQEETQSRFSLAETSPFCQGTLGEQLGYVSNTETAVQILTGQYAAPAGLSDATTLLIDEIGRVGMQIRRGAVRLSISPTEFQEYWRAMNEETSSSASRIHFGHYKVAAQVDSLSKYFAKKISWIARTGCPPSRWGIGLTVLLEKVAGIALVHKLRAILLMEADFNMHNRLIFGDRMMESAREAGLIPEEQYAEKQSDGQDGAWLKRLLADISRQARISLGIVSADAANCYDQIAHAFASLVFQAFGVGISAVCALLCTIQHMKFFLRTAFGESPTFMTAMLGAIIHGLCQGNTAAPAGWSTISAILISAYKRKGHGAKVLTPITQSPWDTAGVLYVDDVDLTTMDSDLDTLELWDEVQDSTFDWTAFLCGPGGSAKPEKCFGYLIAYEWHPDGSWSYQLVDGIDLKVVLPDGSVDSIELLSADEARVMLGIATTPSGNDWHHLSAPGKSSDKWRSIATRAESWLAKLRNCHLPSKYTWVSYRFQLWASLRYGLGVLSARSGELGEITHNFAYRALAYLGVNRNIMAEWRYIHSTFGGCGLIDLSTESVIARLNMFVQHWGAATPIGRSLRTSMEYLQLEIGCAGCPFLEPFDFMGEWCTHSWLRSFWEMAWKYNLHLVVDYPIIPFPREHDALIMDLAKTRGLSGTTLRSFNRCRLASCCMFLSDLASANGQRLDPTRGKPNTDYGPFTRYSFQIERPSSADWGVWEQFWRCYCHVDGSLPRSLGKWTHSTHRIWEWYYDEVSDMVFQCVSGITWQYCICLDPDATDSRRWTRRNLVYSRCGTIDSQHQPCGTPISVRLLGEGSVMRLHCGPDLLPSQDSKEDDFWTFLRKWKGDWIWDEVNTPQGFDAVVEGIRNGTATYVTDGSYNRSVQSDMDGAGWVIYCSVARQTIVLEGSFFERNVKAGSYRGELLGLLAIHLFVLGVETFFSLQTPNLGTVACDNLAGLNKSKERRKKIPPRAKHADILRCLRQVHSLLKGRLSYQHVYGHQDRRKSWAQMSLLEQLNCRCDALAKAAVRRGILSAPGYAVSTQQLPMESAAVYFQSQKLSGECGSEIRFQVGRAEARNLYVNKLGWYASVFDSVDWEARDRALDSKPDMFKMWLCKQGTSFCASGRNMGRWFGDKATACPNCGQPDEHASHLLHCPDAGRFGLFREETKVLAQWLHQPHTHADLARVLPLYILHRGGRSFASLVTRYPALQQLAASQDLIGWDHFMEGKITSLFHKLQRDHLLASSSLLTAQDWTKRLIDSLLHITHGQWIYRNVSRHHERHGLLKLTERHALLREIDRYMNTDPAEVPEESKFLLEIDFQRLRHDHTEKQSYWVVAIRSAVKAGRRARLTRRRQPPRQPSASGPAVRFGYTDTPDLSWTAAGEKRRTVGSGSVSDKSNKRRKPD